MAVIASLDLMTKHIYLATGVREFHPVDDIYKEIRALRRTVEEYRGFDTPVFASGNVAKGGGKYTPRLATFRNGWKIVPEDTSHVLYVTGEQITDEGEAGPACFDLEPLSASSKVIVQYEPPSAEIIETGVSGLTEEESGELMKVSAVKAKTDNLPTDPAVESSVQDIQDKIGIPTSTLAGDIDGIELKTEDIAVKTANIPEDPADQSLLQAALDEIKAKMGKQGAQFRG